MINHTKKAHRSAHSAIFVPDMYFGVHTDLHEKSSLRAKSCSGHRCMSITLKVSPREKCAPSRMLKWGFVSAFRSHLFFEETHLNLSQCDLHFRRLSVLKGRRSLSFLCVSGTRGTLCCNIMQFLLLLFCIKEGTRTEFGKYILFVPLWWVQGILPLSRRNPDVFRIKFVFSGHRERR